MTKAASRRLFLAASLAAALLAAPGVSSPPRVIALLSSGSAPYRDFLSGFSARFEGTVTEIILQDSNQSIDLGNADLVLALGSKAADYVAAQPPKAPVLIGMVYWPEGPGLAVEIKDDARVAALSLRPPPERVLEALDMVRPPDQAPLRMGVVWPEGRDETELAAIREALQKSGYKLDLRQVPRGRDPAADYRELLPKIDALWLIADPAVIPGPDFLKWLLKSALDRKVAVIGLSDTHVRSGALLALSVDYRLEGEAAARLAQRLLSGETGIGTLPPQNLARSLNARVAEELGWPVARTTRQRFERVYP